MAPHTSLKGMVISILQYYGVLLSTLAVVLPLMLMGVMAVVVLLGFQDLSDPAMALASLFIGAVCVIGSLPFILAGITGDFFLLVYRKGWFARRFGWSSQRDRPSPPPLSGQGPPRPPWFAGPGTGTPKFSAPYPGPGIPRPAPWAAGHGQWHSQDHPVWHPPYPADHYPPYDHPEYQGPAFPPYGAPFSRWSVRSDAKRSKRLVRVDLQLPPLRFSLPLLLVAIVLSLISYLGLLVGYSAGSLLGAFLFLFSLLFFALGFFLILTTPPIFWFQVLQKGKSLVVNKRDMLSAFAWGLFSPIPVLVIVLGMDFVYQAITGSPVNDNFDTAVTAPVVEELCKALGLLLLLKRIRNPYDGMLIGFCAGAGFSVCENLLYFTSVAGSGFGAGIATGFSDWAFVAVVRSIMAVESHALGTSLVGLGLGFYLEGKRRGSGFLPAILFGYLGAVALHAAWNGSIILMDALVPRVLGEGILGGAFTIAFIICFFIGELLVLLTAKRRCKAWEDKGSHSVGPKGQGPPGRTTA